MDYAYLAAGIGAGLVVIGAGLGIGRLAGSALEAIGRQPEAVGDIRTSMIIAADSCRRCCAFRSCYLHSFSNKIIRFISYGFSFKKKVQDVYLGLPVFIF